MKLQILLLLVLMLFAAPGFAQEMFVSRQWGFTMQAPKNWLPMTRKDRAENVDKIDFSEEALAKILELDKGTSFLQGYYKYDPKTTPGLIPTIQIQARRKPPVDFDVFKAQLIKSSASFKDIFPDIVFGEPEVVEISGIKSLLRTATFTVKSAHGETLRSRTRIYSIPLKNHFFQVTFNDGQDEKLDCLEEFLQLSKTIKIENR